MRGLQVVPEGCSRSIFSAKRREQVPVVVPKWFPPSSHRWEQGEPRQVVPLVPPLSEGNRELVVSEMAVGACVRGPGTALARALVVA